MLLGQLEGTSVRAQERSSGYMVYRTAAAILALPPDEASQGYSAKLRGVVTHSAEQGMVIHDATAGIWVYSNDAGRYAPGDELEVEGMIAPGMFAPEINVSTVRKVGRSALPKPERASFRQLSSGDMDAQYVTIVGMVHSVVSRRAAPPSERMSMKIKIDGGYVIATLPETGGKFDVHTFVDALVSVTATAMCSKNNNRQIIAPILAASSLDNVAVLRPSPPDPFSKPLTPISRLMQYRSGTDLDHRVHVAGRLTYYQPGEGLVIEDGSAALNIRTTQMADLALGDRVTVLGFPTPQDSGPILEDAVLQRVSSGTPLSPTPVKLADIHSGKLNYNLITTEGRLVRQLHEPSREVLIIQDKSAIVLAELDAPEGKTRLGTIPEGSSIRISGISTLEIAGTWNYGINSPKDVRCKLLLRSPDDVKIIEPPAWWTTRHVIYIAFGMGALALMFLIHAIRSLVERWRLQTVLAERERLAHEIHDTLAQSFAGIGFQLQAIRRAIPQELPGVRQQVDLAQALVRHSHKEARRSIEPLRSEPQEVVDLLPELSRCAQKMVEGGSVKISTSTSGNSRPIPDHIANTLLRIGQEAIANAIRHADPSHLEIALLYKKSTVTLSVQDDGIGFVKRGDLLGFGLRGMRKRAASIDADLKIRTQPGSGSCIIVTAPLPPSFEVVATWSSFWNYISERRSHV